MLLKGRLLQGGPEMRTGRILSVANAGHCCPLWKPFPQQRLQRTVDEAQLRPFAEGAAMLAQRLSAAAAVALIVLLALALAQPACAETMRLLGAEPRPNQVMSGSGVAFALHFDHPLDHEASRFMLVGANGTSRTVPVRLQSRPSVLYGSVGQLPPGRYTLNWSARASNGAALSGTLPFTVGPAH